MGMIVAGQGGALTSATVYYYAENDAPDSTDNYWHYDEDGNPVAW